WVHRLRKQRPSVEEFHVLRIVVEAQYSLYFPCANPEAVLKLVVAKRPVQGRMPIAQVAYVADVHLRSDAKPVGNWRGYVKPSIRHGEAAGASVHREVVVAVRVRKTLRQEAVHLNGATVDCETR